METVLGMTELQIKLFTAIGQIAVACIVGYIAFQQWRTARKKLKADLFDRRFAAYRELVDLTTQVLNPSSSDEAQGSPSSTDAAFQLERVAQEMSWLFDREVSIYVKRNIALPALSYLFDGFDHAACMDSNLKADLAEQLSIQARDIHNNLLRVTRLVGPYLKLDH